MIGVESRIMGSYNEYMEDAGSYDQSPSKDFEFHELNAVIRRIIDSLPPKRKKIFLLSPIRGLTYRDIADKLGILSIL